MISSYYMNAGSVYLQAGVNAFLCACVVAICICRLDKIDKSVRLRVGSQYVILLMAAAALGLAPFLWEFPGWTTVTFVIAVLFMLLADSYQWKHGPPEAATDHAPTLGRAMKRTSNQWKNIFVSMGVVPVTADVWAPIFEEVVDETSFSLGDKELDDFLANILHESQMFEKLEEGLTYRTPGRLMAVWPSRFPTRESEQGYLNNPEGLANKVYGGRLGNVNPGDGWKYRGGGLIMVTGAANHKALQDRLGIPVFDDPSRLRRATKECLQVAIAWWEQNVPDAFMGNVPRTRKAVNGGDIGLADVQRLTNLAGNVL